MSYTIRQLQRAQQRPDTASEVTARIRRNVICAQVRREVDERWPVISAANIDAALAYQSRRFSELDKEVA